MIEPKSVIWVTLCSTDQEAEAVNSLRYQIEHDNFSYGSPNFDQAGVCFIDGIDHYIISEYEILPADRIGEQPVEHRRHVQRVGRPNPLNDIAVIILMRRLDQIDQNIFHQVTYD